MCCTFKVVRYSTTTVQVLKGSYDLQIVALQQAMSPFKHLHGGHQNICSTVAFRAHKPWEGKCQPFLLSPLYWMPNHS